MKIYVLVTKNTYLWHAYLHSLINLIFVKIVFSGEIRRMGIFWYQMNSKTKIDQHFEVVMEKSVFAKSWGIQPSFRNNYVLEWKINRTTSKIDFHLKIQDFRSGRNDEKINILWWKSMLEVRLLYWFLIPKHNYF